MECLGFRNIIESIGFRRRSASSTVIDEKGPLHICHHTQAYSFLFRK